MAGARLGVLELQDTLVGQRGVLAVIVRLVGSGAAGTEMALVRAMVSRHLSRRLHYYLIRGEAYELIDVAKSDQLFVTVEQSRTAGVANR